MTNEEIGREIVAVRRLLEALIGALAPEETPAERTLLDALADLTNAVDETGGVVSTLHSHVSRLALPRPVSEHA